MTLDTNNFKEVGGPGNSIEGGQVYSIFSTTDSIATMLAANYLDALVESLNVRDLVHLSGTDGLQTVQISANDGATVTTRNALDAPGSIQSVTGDGAANLTTDITEWTTTSTDDLTLADGAAGQTKKIIMVADGGDGTFTVANLLGGTTITFDAVGDAVTLTFATGGWAITGIFGAAVT